jgi:hypothetical protein
MGSKYTDRIENYVKGVNERLGKINNDMEVVYRYNSGVGHAFDVYLDKEPGYTLMSGMKGREGLLYAQAMDATFELVLGVLFIEHFEKESTIVP